jgi:antitoxin YefM
MDLLLISEARKNLYKLVDNIANTHIPTLIKGKRNNAVLLAKEDWDNIQETLYLLSIPKMGELILEADKEPIDKCAKELDW